MSGQVNFPFDIFPGGCPNKIEGSTSPWLAGGRAHENIAILRCGFDCPPNFSRDSSVAERDNHNLRVVGAIPTPATKIHGPGELQPAPGGGRRGVMPLCRGHQSIWATRHGELTCTRGIPRSEG